MNHRAMKVIADWFYLTPITLNKFQKNNPDETIHAYGATKGQLHDSEQPLAAYGWRSARRNTLILTNECLICGDWKIPLSKVKYAETQYDALEGADALMIMTEWPEFRTPDFDKMAEKEKACKECGFITTEKECAKCGSKTFADKFKGTAVILDSDRSTVSEKLSKTESGKYAMKY